MPQDITNEKSTLTAPSHSLIHVDLCYHVASVGHNELKQYMWSPLPCLYWRPGRAECTLAGRHCSDCDCNCSSCQQTGEHQTCHQCHQLMLRSNQTLWPLIPIGATRPGHLGCHVGQLRQVPEIVLLYILWPLGCLNGILDVILVIKRGWAMYLVWNCRQMLWMSPHCIDNKSTLVLVMAWCCQATGHYLNWLLAYGITLSQWVMSN